MASSTSPAQASWPSIAEFYAGKDVFITGATGFMGVCLVEKLLRSVPDIGNVHVLIRPKKGKTAKARVEDMLQTKLFEKLRYERPEVLEKVIPIEGDILVPVLGISESDQQLLIDNVAAIFHLAATVRFDAPLREAFQCNVISVMEMVKLSRRFKKLSTYVHVSTAYAHCNRENDSLIEEIVYPPETHPEKLLQLLDWMSDTQLDALTPLLLEGRPNTYTYTKALAEYYLANEAKGLPLAIFRPSIIGAAYKEPYPGWVDRINGPGGIGVAFGTGLLRVLKYKDGGLVDIVPLDLVNNMVISIGWVTGVNPSTQPIIYHLTSGSSNPLTWAQMCSYGEKSFNAYPFEQMFRRPWVMQCRPASMWPVWDFIWHYVPCFVLDLLLRIRRKKPRMVKLYKKLMTGLDVMGFFIENDWNWSHRNHDRLLSLMSSEDKRVFDFDIRKLNWKEYIDVWIIGAKLYIFKEDLANLPRARKKMQRFRALAITFRALMVVLGTTLIYQKSQFARQLWNTTLGHSLLWLAKIGLVVRKVLLLASY